MQAVLNFWCIKADHLKSHMKRKDGDKIKIVAPLTWVGCWFMQSVWLQILLHEPHKDTAWRSSVNVCADFKHFFSSLMKTQCLCLNISSCNHCDLKYFVSAATQWRHGVAAFAWSVILVDAIIVTSNSSSAVIWKHDLYFSSWYDCDFQQPYEDMPWRRWRGVCLVAGGRLRAHASLVHSPVKISRGAGGGVLTHPCLYRK